MGSRRYAPSEISDRYESRREYGSPQSGRRDERIWEDEIEYRSRAPPPRERERERERERTTVVREEVRTRERSPPDFLREDYGKTTSGPMVLRAREREDFEYAPRRRSPSLESNRKVDREEIVIRREIDDRREPPPPPPPAPRDHEREEIIIRRGEERDRGGPPQSRDVERDEIIIRRGEDRDRERDRGPPPQSRDRDIERDEIIIRRGEDRDRDRSRPPPPRDIERDEIIIRREERDSDRRPPPPRDIDRDDFIGRRGEGPRYLPYERDRGYDPRPPVREEYERDELIIRRERDDSVDVPRYHNRDDPYGPPRAISHERERSRMGRGRGESDADEIIIRREEREGRNGREREREEIIIRRNESRSPSPASVRAPLPDRVINAPAIHQEVITHHRHIDHGYEMALAPPVRSRPPTPPTPPREDDERIEIHRRGEKNGKSYHEDIIIDRDQSRSAPPPRHRHDELDRMPPPERMAPPSDSYRDSRDSREIQEEAEYYNQRALSRAHPGEGWHGTTNDWAIVDVPPGTRRVRMDGAGGGSQEITWQRYNGVRRSKFRPDGSDEGYGSEVSRPPPLPASSSGPLIPAPLPSSGGELARRYAGQRNPKDGLWTEITKDLVVKEAITEAGYEFEETDDFFYVIAYLKYDDVARLVGLSEDIHHARRKRAKELQRERRHPEPVFEREPPRRPLAIKDIPSRPRPPPSGGPWDHEEERYIEREWGRPRPPPGRW